MLSQGDDARGQGLPAVPLMAGSCMDGGSFIAGIGMLNFYTGHEAQSSEAGLTGVNAKTDLNIFLHLNVSPV